MNIQFDKQYRLVNPSVQIHTSLFAMQNEGFELEDTGEPVFDDEGSNSEPFNMFHEMDPLTYRSYNPSEVKAARELEKSKDLSARQAQNINSVKP